jgi:HEAT repeat protein
MKCRERTLAIAVVYISVSTIVLGDPPQVWSAVDALSKGQTATDHLAALESFRANRSTSVAQLLLLLENAKKPRSTRLTAAKMLGILRASEAVEALVASMTLTPELIDDRSVYGLYPCVKALAEIGKPSTPKMLANLRTSSDPTVRKLSLKVLVDVEGRETASFLLKRLLAGEEETQNRERLESVLASLEAGKGY